MKIWGVATLQKTGISSCSMLGDDNRVLVGGFLQSDCGLNETQSEKRDCRLQ